MIVQADIHFVINPINQFVAVARQEVGDVDLALLQIFVRIERGEQPFDLLFRGLVAFAASVDEARAEVVKLVENLSRPPFNASASVASTAMSEARSFSS